MIRGAGEVAGFARRCGQPGVPGDRGTAERAHGGGRRRAQPPVARNPATGGAGAQAASMAQAIAMRRTRQLPRAREARRPPAKHLICAAPERR